MVNPPVGGQLGVATLPSLLQQPCYEWPVAATASSPPHLRVPFFLFLHVAAEFFRKYYSVLCMYIRGVLVLLEEAMTAVAS